MFQPRCQSVNYNRVTRECQLLDTNVYNQNEVQNGNQFDDQKDWVYYGQKEKVITNQWIKITNTLLHFP